MSEEQEPLLIDEGVPYTPEENDRRIAEAQRRMGGWPNPWDAYRVCAPCPADLFKIEQHSAVVHQCLDLWRNGSLTMEQALIMAVKEMDQQLQAYDQAEFKRRLTEPLVIPLKNGMRFDPVTGCFSLVEAEASE